MWKSVLAKMHKDAEREQAECDRQTRKFFKDAEAQRRKLPKRDLSQINFQAQHWWTDQLKMRDRISIDEEKAALIYEAMRRCSEVQQAWLEGKFGTGANGWQNFVGFVVQNLPKSWIELDQITQHTLVKIIGLPWFIPPKGYSTFPENPEKAPRKLKGKERKFWEAETKERREAARKRCQEAAAKILHIPASDDPASAQGFVKRARKFEDAGFVIVAMDNKTKQGIRYACEAIEALHRSVRKADLKEERIALLPPNISASDKQAVEEKHRQGIYTKRDHDELWDKYIKPTSDLHSPWHKVEEARPVVLHKRKRGEKLVEEKLFNFKQICRDLERMDLGITPKDDFVQRVRLC